MIRRKKYHVMLVLLCFTLAAVLYWLIDSYYAHEVKISSYSQLQAFELLNEISASSLCDPEQLHPPHSPQIPDPVTLTPHVTEDRTDLRSSYLMKYQPHHFVIPNSFTLPIPRVTLPIYELIQRDWMGTLRDYLYEIPPHSNTSHISIVTCDSKFKDVLLNWLISAMVTAQPPLSHILILALDRPLHTALAERGFDSVLVEPKELLHSVTVQQIAASNRKAFYVVMVLRLTVMRLMNHWGYSVANYDTDAIIIKNPEQVFYGDFNHSDLIGSRGKFPKSVRALFGLTLCAGVFMVKSTSQIERFWKIVSQVIMKKSNSPDDQERLNLALTKMDLVFDHNTTTVSDQRHWVASNGRGFTATILDLNTVCRKNCKRRELPSYYVWHRGGKFSEGKVERAQSDHVWLLRKDWMQVAQNSTATGTKWLEELRS